MKELLEEEFQNSISDASMTKPSILTSTYSELPKSEPQSLSRIRRELPIPPNAPLGSTNASVRSDFARGIRYPPISKANATPPPIKLDGGKRRKRKSKKYIFRRKNKTLKRY